MGEDTVRQRKVGGGDAGVAGDDQPRKGSGTDREDDVSWLSYLSGSAWLVLAFAVASYFVFVSVAHQKEVLGAAGEVDSDLFSTRKEAITALLAFYQGELRENNLFAGVCSAALAGFRCGEGGARTYGN